MNDKDIAWLAGIIDGEGSVSFQVTFRKTGNLCIVPFITITNADEGILQNASRILNENSVKHDRQQQVKKTVFTLRVSRQEAISKLITLLKKELKSFKKDNLLVLEDFIQLRKDTLFTRNSKGQLVRNMYTENQIRLMQSVRTRPDGHQLDRILSAPNVLKNKI